MRALLVYPRYPDTFWSFKHALRFVRRKAAFPPLGLLTVAAMLPAGWEQRLRDLNVEPLGDEDLAWAEVVLISAMVVQRDSAREVLERCRKMGKKVVAGGPLFTHLPHDLPGVDHVVAGEAEDLLPELLSDLEQNKARFLYQSEGHPSLQSTPPPKWELINLKNYRTLSMQVSRGCPFDCDFCDVVALFGRRPRFKEPDQVVEELEQLRALKWRGAVMVVDDNFIGHKGRAKELLAIMADWQKDHGQPFSFFTQASVNLADDHELLHLMTQANFTEVFLGLETPSESSLKECHKEQNRGRDLLDAVRTIQGYGIEVMAGFIVGFDADPPSIFKDQVSFISQAAIPTAMVGLLSLMPGTKLYERMRGQDRLLGLPSGDNAMDVNALNFIPKMGAAALVEGYKDILRRLYEPKAYYRRSLVYLRRSGRALKRRAAPKARVSLPDLIAGVRIFWRLGVVERGRLAYWAFLARVGFSRPAKIPMAISLAATGYHLRKVTRRFVRAASPPLEMTEQA